jgi:hypothetical protein
LEGAASQLETFDPHPGSSINCGAKVIETAVRGIKFGEGLILTAERAQDFSILRAVTSKEGDNTRVNNPLPKIFAEKIELKFSVAKREREWSS